MQCRGCGSQAGRPTQLPPCLGARAVPRAGPPNDAQRRCVDPPTCFARTERRQKPPHVAGYSSVAGRRARSGRAASWREGAPCLDAPGGLFLALAQADVDRHAPRVRLRRYTVRSTPRGASRACWRTATIHVGRGRVRAHMHGYGRAIVAVLFIYLFSMAAFMVGARLVHARGSSCPEIGASNAVYASTQRRRSSARNGGAQGS